MKNYLKFSFAIILILGLTTNPIVSFAFNADKTALYNKIISNASKHSGIKSDNSGAGRTSTLPNAGAIKLPRAIASRGEVAGQSTTLLPDGRLLKAGGFGAEGMLSLISIVDRKSVV